MDTSKLKELVTLYREAEGRRSDAQDLLATRIMADLNQCTRLLGQAGVLAPVTGHDPLTFEIACDGDQAALVFTITRAGNIRVEMFGFPDSEGERSKLEGERATFEKSPEDFANEDIAKLVLDFGRQALEAG